MTADQTDASKADGLRRQAEKRLQKRPAGHTCLPTNTAETTRLFHELQVHQIELQIQNEELLQAQTRVENYAQELEAIHRHAPTIMFLADKTGHVRKMNRRGVEFADRQAPGTHEGALGHVFQCCHALDDAAGCGFGPSCRTCQIRNMILATTASGETCEQKEVKFTGAPGLKDNHRYFLLSSVPLRLKDNPTALVNLLDITDRKNAEAEQEDLRVQLQQAQKLSAVGQLAGGIAHNYNNQLTGVLGYAQMLLPHLTEDRLRRFTRGIITAANRSAELVEQLLYFSRQGTHLLKPIDLHLLIEETLALLEQTIDRRIEIQRHLAAPNATVVGDATQLQSMLLNLCLNAADAMPSGGALTCSTKHLHLTGKQAEALSLEPGRHLCITLADDGVGMTEDTKAHVFEPFFTTKAAGNGTGLGLASAYGTVLSHRGMIAFESGENQGTTFSIYLPLAAPTPLHQSATPDAEDAEQVKKGAHILLVDDEKVLIALLTDMLNELGCTATPCYDGEEAVSYYRNHWPEVDLVILDMVMPRMGGHETFQALRAINPAAKVLIASGHSISGAVDDMLENGALGFVKKPFELKILEQKIAEAVHADAQAGE